MSEWAAQQVPSPSAPGTVTLVEGTAFCVSTPSGDILPGGTEGVFFRDTRLASRWELLIDSEPVEPMAVYPGQAVLRHVRGAKPPRPGRGESTVLVTRTRYVGDGLREDIEVHNFGDGIRRPAHQPEGGVGPRGHLRRQGEPYPEPVQRSLDAASDALVISSRLRDRMRGARVSAEGASVSASGLFFVAVVPPRDSWRVTALIQPIIDGQTLASRFPLDQPVESADPAQRQDAWERGSPVAETTSPGPGPGVAMQPRRPRLAADLRHRAA